MRTKTKVVTGLAAAALATSVGLGASTATGSSGSDDGEDSPKFTSSITAPDDDANETDGAKQEGDTTEGDTTEGDKTEGDDAAHEAADAADQTTLQKLATVDAATAKAAALDRVPGTADSVELENADGNVVWTVQVTNSAGLKTTVFVDAGTAKVLATKAHDHEDNDGTEGTEAPDGADD